MISVVIVIGWIQARESSARAALMNARAARSTPMSRVIHAGHRC
jgi:hypothetical protein